MFSFQRLNVYTDSKELVALVYQLLRKYPNFEQYALCDQLRRAVISVPSNIAEGMSRISCKEQIHFLEISFGSLMEVLCQMEISKDLKYITLEDYTLIQNLVEKVSKQLSGLRKSILAKIERV